MRHSYQGTGGWLRSAGVRQVMVALLGRRPSRPAPLLGASLNKAPEPHLSSKQHTHAQMVHQPIICLAHERRRAACSAFASPAMCTCGFSMLTLSAAAAAAAAAVGGAGAATAGAAGCDPRGAFLISLFPRRPQSCSGRVEALAASANLSKARRHALHFALVAL